MMKKMNKMDKKWTAEILDEHDDNTFAMMILSEFLNAGHYLLLYTFLNLGYADFTYEIKDYGIKNHIVTAMFGKTPSELKYVLEQKARRVRVAFSALSEYCNKENRNALRINLDVNSELLANCFAELNRAGTKYAQYNRELSILLGNSNVSNGELRELVSKIPDPSNNKYIVASRNNILQMMNNIAEYLSEKWDDLRYSRDLSD